MQVINWMRSSDAPAGRGGGGGASASTGLVATAHFNLWRDSQAFELHVYVGESDDFVALNKDSLVWHQRDLKYNWDASNERTLNMSIPVTPHMLNNGSVYAHIFLTHKNVPHDPDAPRYKPQAVVHSIQQLNKYLKRPKLNVRKNLITGEYIDERVVKEIEDLTAPEDRQLRVKELKKMPIEVVSFWQPTLSLRLVHDFTQYAQDGIPPQMVEHLRIDPATKGYAPPLYVDRFWSLKTQLVQINASRTELPLELAFAPISLWRWMIQTSMEQSWSMQESWGLAREVDQLSGHCLMLARILTLFARAPGRVGRREAHVDGH